ncbi:MAG: TraB/GumN family protein [Motiliproteus sp.]
MPKLYLLAVNLKHSVNLFTTLSLAMLLLLPTLTQATEPSPVPTQTGKPFLWQVDNGKVSSYLFGTIHSGHPELNVLAASVESAFTQADRFYGELELNSKTISETQQLLLLQGNEQLSQQLSRTQQQRINTLLAQISPGLNLQLFDQFKPWAFTVVLALLEDQVRYGQFTAMDLKLYQRAQVARKITGALETPQQQMALFEQLTSTEQMAMLDATLVAMEKSVSEQQSWMEPTYAAYRSGDPDQLNRLLDQQMALPEPLQRKLKQHLIIDRNHLMASKIDQQLQQHSGQSLFFAVGAGHFDQQEGIQILLQQKGYQVRRLNH